MAFKQFIVPELGPITVYKRKGCRRLRLSVRPDGQLRVTIPAWAPYSAAITFARANQTWISQNKPAAAPLLVSGQAVGKAHHLQFVASPSAAKITTRIQQNQIIVTYPSRQASGDKLTQQAAEKAAIRALRRQAEQLLPQRLRSLAERHGFEYSGVSIKQLKSRWGSCDQQKHIVLNLFLMQLPWHLIDYVLLHELTHTRVMQHGPKFWDAMTAIEPRAIDLRKEIRKHNPTLIVQL